MEGLEPFFYFFYMLFFYFFSFSPYFFSCFLGFTYFFYFLPKIAFFLFLCFFKIIFIDFFNIKLINNLIL